MTQKTYIKWSDLQNQRLRTTIETHIADYTTFLTSLGITNTYTYTLIVKQLLITQSIQPTDVQPEHIDTFLQTLNPSNNYTINSYISRLRKWLRYLEKDFADFIQLPQTKPRPRYNTPDIPNTLRTTLTKELDAYLEYLHTFNRSDTYIDTLRHAITTFHKIIPTPVNDLTQHDILQFIKHLQARDLNPNSINRYRQAIHVYLKFHDKDELLKSIPPVSSRSPLKRTAPINHIQKLLHEAQSPNYPPYLHPLLTLTSFTGIRIGSIFKLETTQLDLDNRWITFWTKRRKQQRLPLNTQLTAILKTYIAEYDPPIYLFPSSPSAPNTPLTNHKLRYWLKKLSHNTKLPHYNPHAYRRAIATYLYYASNENLLFVKTFLNHTKVDTTIRYIDIDYDRFQNTYDTLTQDLASSLFPEPQPLSQSI